MWKYLILAVVVAGGSVWETRAHYMGEINGLKLEQSQALLASQIASNKQFRDNTQRINDASSVYATNTNQLSLQLDEIGKDLKHAEHLAPLPVDCRPDAGRVRVLSQAVDAVNASLARP